VQAGRLFEENRHGDSAAGQLGMADNVARALDRHGKGARAVLWGSSLEAERTSSMNLVVVGEHLARRFGTKFVSLCFLFGEGGFYGWESEASQPLRLRAQEVGLAPDNDASALFVRAGCEACLVDLRVAPRGPVADWLDARRPMREPGALVGADDRQGSGRLSRRFDAVVFVRRTTSEAPATRKR
jgi:erythromycin esterase-like protein